MRRDAHLRDQSWLFDQKPAAPVPHNGTTTSRLAAEAAAPLAPSKRETLRRLIAGMGAKGATIDELASASGMPTQTVCARVNELANQGAIQDSGQVRLTRYGRPATVWVAREAAE